MVHPIYTIIIHIFITIIIIGLASVIPCYIQPPCIIILDRQLVHRLTSTIIIIICIILCIIHWAVGVGVEVLVL